MATTTYTLDGSIVKTNNILVTIETLYTEEQLILTNSDTAQTITLGFVTATSEIERNQASNNINTVSWTIPAQASTAGDTYTLSKTVNSTSYDVLKIDYVKGEITFYVDIRTPLDNYDNITVEFTANIEDTSSDITNCNFGYQFGAEGTEDRLWLSGNKDKPNYLYYSAMDDFSYFPASNYKKLASPANEIVAFSRLSDNTLAIHSKTDGISPTIYYITPRQMEIDGEHTKYEFPMVEGVIGETPLSMNTSHALMGDSIYLSRNGVFGITLGQNISSIERYEHLRSRYVNKKLLAETNLENATAIVYGNRYYLAINNHVYIADARWKVAPEQSDETTFEYEWWYWEDVPVLQWLILNDKLCFLDSKNRLCEFDNKFTDRENYSESLLSSGNFTLVDSTFTYNSSIKLANDDTMRFTFSAIKYNICNEDNLSSVSFEDSDSSIVLMFLDDKYLKEFSIDKTYGLRVETNGTVYSGVVTNINGNSQSITLKISSSSYSTVKQTYQQTNTLQVTEAITDTTCYLTDIDDESNTFKLKRYSDSELTMSLTNETTALLPTLFVVTHYEPIKCKWMTPALSFGYLLYAKNLYGVSIVLDPSVEGLVNFGYTTARTSRSQGDVVSLANEKELVTRERLSEYELYNFDFNNIDFTNFSFETGSFACSRNMKLRVRNFTFIMFKFENNTKGNFAMNSFQLLYDIGKRNKGVR